MMQILQLSKEHQLVDKHGNSLLHLTLKTESFTEKDVLDVLETLLDSSVNLDTKNQANETVLQLAIERRMKSVIDLLLNRKFSTNSATHFMIEDEWIRFYKSLLSETNYFDEVDSEILNAEIESAKFVEWLISRGFDFDVKNEKNQSAVLMAIQLSLQHILPVLLKYTKDITFIDQDNRTLLHLFIGNNVATKHGRYKNRYSNRYTSNIVKILLDRGIQADAEDNSGYTATRLAIENREDIDVVDILFKHTTNVHHEDFRGVSLFNKLIIEWAWSIDANPDYYLKIARILVDRNVDMNKPDINQVYPIHHAVASHNLRIFEFLRDYGADFRLIAYDGETLMHLFVGCHSNIHTHDEAEMKLFEQLLELTVDVNGKNLKGETAFYKLIRNWVHSKDANADYFVKVARDLIAKGADVNEADDSGMTPLVSVVKGHNLRAAEFLEANGADFSVTTEDGGNLIHSLVISRNCNEATEVVAIKLLDILVRHGCQVNFKDNHGMTPLHIAANKGNLAISRKLLEYGAVVNSKNNRMKTPLTDMFTSYYELKADVAELLLEHGANIDSKNADGYTALQTTAVEQRGSDVNVQMLRYLLEHGADFEQRDQAGYSILRVAMCRDYNRYQSPRAQVEPTEVGRLMHCIDTSEEGEVLLNHYVKCNILMGCTKNKYRRLIKRNKNKSYYDKCSNEIETLKRTFIDSFTSFYSFLRMDLNNRRAYIYGEQRRIIHSPTLRADYPEYASFILASYYQAVTRNAIMKPAVDAWLELTRIYLPDDCIEHIFSFLRNSDLFVIIGGD